MDIILYFCQVCSANLASIYNVSFTGLCSGYVHKQGCPKTGVRFPYEYWTAFIVSDEGQNSQCIHTVKCIYKLIWSLYDVPAIKSPLLKEGLFWH